MRIVIFGLARSGTTALFYLLKNALPAGTRCLFEPRVYRPGAMHRGLLGRLFRGRGEGDVLAKVLPFRPTEPAHAESFSSFDRQILTVRDPRDRIVSRLLYAVRHSSFYRSDEQLRAFVQLLKRKEAHPRSVALRELLRVSAEMDGKEFSFDGWAADYARHSIRAPLHFHNERPDLFVCKYEDLIDRSLAGLEKYLGLRLTGEAVVAPQHRHVVRTMTYGTWRDWFTEEDVEWLGPTLEPYLERYYEKADWNLSPRPVIPAEFSSGYVIRIVNEKRAEDWIPLFGD